jgi:hypothetical protein
VELGGHARELLDLLSLPSFFPSFLREESILSLGEVNFVTWGEKDSVSRREEIYLSLRPRD